jgi:hypothetical protein
MTEILSEAGGSASTADSVSPYQKELVKHYSEASGSKGEIQISRMTVRLYCERGEVNFFRVVQNGWRT